MHLTHNILLGLLAVTFLVSGIFKLSGNEKGLEGTRDVNVSDPLARIIGAIEIFFALGMVYALRYPDSLIGWLSILGGWVTMGGAVYAHSRADKMKTAIPAITLLLLFSVVLVIG
jgi:DoxX-like family